MTNGTDSNFDLVPTRLAVAAMRDNGYKNTAYAVAELIDNSIQAGASKVQLLAGERANLVRQRTRSQIDQIAILDNGCGMDAHTLRMALQFGNGTRINDRTGIGRFGMGLPSASISQARRLDVWSWTTSATEAQYTYLDLDEIEQGRRTVVPEPTREAVPSHWQNLSSEIGNSGTLVVWSNLDRAIWRRATTIINRSELLIGRMYREFIVDGSVEIRLAEFDTSNRSAGVTRERFALANDPMYLMQPISTPSPYDATPMFDPDGEQSAVVSYELPDSSGALHSVFVTYSLAKNEVRRESRSAGSTAYGKHAKQNIGVSVVRASRELDLDQALVNSYDPRERWWGVEIKFPPALDELFGVTNNKQSARNFAEIASSIEVLMSEGGRSTAEIQDEMDDNGDIAAPLVEVVADIFTRLRNIREAIQAQARGSRRASARHPGDTAEDQASDVTRIMQGEGLPGESDKGEHLPEEQRVEELSEELQQSDFSAEQAKSLSADTIQRGVKFVFIPGQLDGKAFFNVRPVAGEIVIKINTSHPAYSNLVEVLEDEISPDDQREELADRLIRANRGLKLILMAWARYEDQELNADRKEDLQDIRTDWGRVAARFLRGK